MKKLRMMADKADITKHKHFHVSRHSFATLTLSRGIDIYTISKLMHHSSVAITEIYTNLIKKKRDEVADIINLDITGPELEIVKKSNKKN
jgi:integrase/recombinase XerD